MPCCHRQQRRQYQLKKDENAYGAVPITHDPPAYPAALIGKNLPSAVVRVKAIVDGEGRVTEVRDLDASPGPEHAAFFDACREAVAHWKFTPMTVVQEVEDKKGNITEVRRTAPFSLDYAFNFELVEGRPSVTAATDAGTSSAGSEMPISTMMSTTMAISSNSARRLDASS